MRGKTAGVPAALLSQGLVPTAPYTPSAVFTVRTLELYRSVHLRSPSLALQPFVKGVCDMQGVPFRRAYSDKFNNAYDLYLRILSEVEDRVLLELGRSERIWRLKNACPACTYVLDGEDPLRFGMLVTMDGGNSLKRLARRDIGQEVRGDGMPELGPMRGVEDSRTVSQRYYLSREEVNKWEAPSDATAPGEDDDDAGNPCASRWHNMSSQATAKMWGIFDETGIFLCLCRHGFVLTVCDMVQSGELSKYPLATVNTLLEAFGSRIGCGYDIGCKFSSTIANSALASKAKALEFTSLVGAFHGHAHNRLCQLSNLATYVTGLGLEDLEGCERMFSKSNNLAASLRHTSRFHRTQKIDQYFHHMDSYETMANLSKFIVDNYNQALEIISGQDDLARMMREHGVQNVEVFSQWLEEERKYLTGLTAEPVKETLQMDYYQALVDWNARKYVVLFTGLRRALISRARAEVEEARGAFIQHNPNEQPSTGGKRKRSPETQMRHANELHDKALRSVMDLEVKLDIKKRWEAGSKDWVAAAELVSQRRYQRCLDQLESLIVSRMFELTKMNMSKTGYKLRRHISKSLQTRSQAIRTALERYNNAAAAMKPARPSLSWDQVVEYAFLADFDLLRVSREDIRSRQWAQPIPRAMMHQYFKIQRAREEIHRLDIEIRRVVTYIQDERAFLERAVRFKKLKDAVLKVAAALIPGVPVDKTLRCTPTEGEVQRPDAPVILEAAAPRGEDEDEEAEARAEEEEEDEEEVAESHTIDEALASQG
ncbi:hypothetical protein DFP72DRAFT_994703 [Ephemerocybe angulata]|uniref:CxC2-like cysteine cluster KDZ transposase-associated domain-containing protein n=1 Tax=Ephemerocybe angulata TaxID=980116 RepID=A0A8H6LUW0_9AGAR|nr:hypothetical protein DFP72DRAFT_994703 [Tulosesus angulatus]